VRKTDSPSNGERGAGGGAARPSSLFAVGRNCCAVARASRVGLLVDGEDYFRAFALAAERATRSIAILAWDFHSGTSLRFDPEDGTDARRGRGRAPSPPARLGTFLNWLVRRRRDLQVHILNWRYPIVFGADREIPLRFGLGWRPHRRVHLEYDDTHPLSGAHHQKIVVIDDAIAFIGGIDLTLRRWDTCAHRADESRRQCAGRPYPPFHDMMMMVEGAAAAALADIVRARWRAATGAALPRPPPARASTTALWPDGLEVAFRDVDVALSRTLPPRADQATVGEVEALFLDMIAAARRRIYIENQYFTADRIGEALAARLEEADGPEIVVVVRRFGHRWLEEYTMHVLRGRLTRRLRGADRHGRFHIYYPHVDRLGERTCLDLHSKLMIVDDEILRIGSANLCNRSMGMDSECDAALEARGDARVAAAIAAYRNRLLGEHLDVPPAAVAAAVREQGSLSGAVAALAGRSRTLRALQDRCDWPQAVVELAGVGDPRRPASLERLIEGFVPGTPAADGLPSPSPRRGLIGAALFVLAIATLSATLGAM
jgi:phosphatidylserine/phosphatidylglycerophosphate/cardiolipin synthase-like enzyme